MSALTLRIATLLIGGVGIGVTLGAMLFSTLPVWLGLVVMLGISLAVTASE